MKTLKIGFDDSVDWDRRLPKLNSHCSSLNQLKMLPTGLSSSELAQGGTLDSHTQRSLGRQPRIRCENGGQYSQDQQSTRPGKVEPSASS